MRKTKSQNENQEQNTLTLIDFDEEITLRQKQIREQTSQLIIQLEQQLLDELSEIPSPLLGMKMGVLIDQYDGDLAAVLTGKENNQIKLEEYPQKEIPKIKDSISNLFLCEPNQGMSQEQNVPQKEPRKQQIASSTVSPSKKSLNKEMSIDQKNDKETTNREESQIPTNLKKISQKKKKLINTSPQKKKDCVSIQDLLNKKGFFRRDVSLIQIFNSRSFETKYFANN
ncbi:australin [Anaeramoeba flamelloides]|uniref:Australin n=1 Tax=Anaeramoeba flamelloides TaxID=1746091 RepID=A0ABQ8YM38_9EUKA|nr:australin [Anaeramoeba flamelloides]